MPIINLVITDGADDGEIDTRYSSFCANGEGGYDYIGAYSGGEVFGFFRFDLPISLAGKTIDSAILSLRGFDTWNWNSTSEFIRIWVTASSDAARPTSAANTPSIATYNPGNTTLYPSTLTSGIRWPASGGLTWSTSGYNASPDISSLIQHLIDSSGLTDGHITVWVGSPASEVSDSEVSCYDYGTDPTKAAKLDITYSDASNSISGAGGIDSAEAFGSPTITEVLSYPISVVGDIASTEAFGSPTVSVDGVYSIVGAGNISSAGAFGLPTVTGSVTTERTGKTSSKVTFGLYDLEIRQDGSPSYTGNLQPFAKVNDLVTGNIASLPYATFEPNFWSLDGKYKFMPPTASMVHVGIMSLHQSGPDGVFATSPILTVIFSEPHTTDGLILHFSPLTNDYASAIEVTYFNEAEAAIFYGLYAPTSADYEIDLNVTDFTRLEIKFNATNKPYRYLRVTGLDYGQLIEFTSGDIKRLEVVEEIDPLSLRVPVNICELKLYSTTDLFSIFNNEGYYSRLSKRQPLSIYGILDGATVFMGQYYLDEWKNAGKRNIEFYCVDLAGILGRTPFRGGMYNAALAGEVIDTILEGASIPYDLDEDLYNLPLTGWIPYCSCREALQQIAFVLGSFVDCSRSYALKIYKSTLAVGQTNPIELKRESQGLNSGAELKPLVTGVELTAHEYLEGTDEINLFDSTLEYGTHEIQFNQPAHTLTVEGATLVESGVNYAIVNVTAASSQVTISGLSYVDTTRLFSVTTTGLNRYVMPNIVQIEDATLVNPSNGASLAQRVHDYYQMRFSQKTKMFGSFFEPGQVLVSEVGVSSQRIQGTIEKMTVNLSGGFICNLDIVGVKV